MQLTIRTDTERARSILDRAKAGLGDRALNRALNRTVDGARTQMSRAIRDDYNVSAALVRDKLQVRGSRRQGANAFVAVLVGNPIAGGKRRSLNMVHFLERQVSFAQARKRRRAGTLHELYFQIKRSGSKQMIRGAFLGNQGRTVFVRKGAARLPIVPLQTIGIPQMFSTKKNTGIVHRWIIANFPRIFDNEARFYLSTVR